MSAGHTSHLIESATAAPARSGARTAAEVAAFADTPNVPYTHRDHAKACRDAAVSGVTLTGQFVQARVGRTTCCARIVGAWDTSDGLEMWRLDFMHPIRGQWSAPSRNVRQWGA